MQLLLDHYDILKEILASDTDSCYQDIRHTHAKVVHDLESKALLDGLFNKFRNRMALLKELNDANLVSDYDYEKAKLMYSDAVEGYFIKKIK